MKLAIIGTAGRGEDYNKLTKQKWIEVKKKVLSFVNSWRPKELVSGAAAFADHLSVEIFVAKQRGDLNCSVENLTLYLPCEFDITKNKFVEDGPKSCGSAANYYHKRFSERTARNSFSWLTEAYIHEKCTTVIGDGFFARNAQVANHADMLLAITFGNKNKVKEGGTAHTTGLFIKKNGNLGAFHLDLNSMEIYPNAVV